MNKTAFVYDPFNLRHTKEGHPENYRRLEGTWALLEADGILERLQRVASTPVALEQILEVHTPHYLEQLRALSDQGGGHLDADTYVNGDSYQAALLAAGGLLNTVDAVLTGQADNSFALVRPPGHHALPHVGMGFCLLGNVAIAARWAQQQYGIDRVLIVDFDVHHGNGTQDIFYNDPSVLFFSTHQYPHYPGTGNVDEMGTELAYGTTINVPMPPLVGDAGHLDAFRRVLAPAARRFQPELILLSAGYDAHWMDPLAHIQLSIPGYTQLVHEVMALADELCGGRLVCTLEGGYHLEVLAHAVLSTLRTLSDTSSEISDPFGLAPDREYDVVQLLEQICARHDL